VVKIRLQKLGRRNRAFFRIVVSDVRTKRQGAYLEKLGQYDPVESVEAKQLGINMERYNHWVSQGAQATDAVKNLISKFGGHAPAAAAPAKPAAAAK
jgi:small subunit ribosomal protein S16